MTDAAGPPGPLIGSGRFDGLPWWLSPVARGLVRVFLNRFRAAVHDDPGPHLSRAAEYRLRDPNVRPAEAARLRRLAGLPAGSRS